MRNLWKGLLIGGAVGVAGAAAVELGNGEPAMKSAWKGFVAGASAGALGALIVNAVSGRSRSLPVTVPTAWIPDVGDLVKTATGRAAELIADADVPDRVREAVHGLTDHNLAEQLRHVGSLATDRVGGLADHNLAEQLRHVGSLATDRVGELASSLRS